MRLNNYFQSGMVIQAGELVTIKGYLEGCEKVVGHIESEGKTIDGISSIDGDRFCVTFDGCEPSLNKYRIVIEGEKEKIVLDDVMFGDVYLCAGQSNMEIGLQYMIEPEKIYDEYRGFAISIIDIRNRMTKYTGGGFVGLKEGADDISCDEKWVRNGTYEELIDTPGFSYIFSGMMQKKTGYPVGIVNTAVGGSDIHHWIKKEHFSDPFLEKAKERIDEIEGRSDAECILNEKIAPLSSIRFKAVLWLLGESLGFLDYDQIRLYERELEYLDEDFGNFLGYKPSFCLIDIGVESYGHYFVSMINEQISRFATSEKSRFIECPVFDLSSEWLRKDGSIYPHPIHIIDKVPQARRVADMVYENFVLGKRLVPPRISGEKRDGDSIILSVDTRTGLHAKTYGRIRGFSIAGDDGNYVVANAELIDQRTIRVHSEFVSNPKYVTYLFYDYNQDAQLYEESLPLMPYRSNMDEDPNEKGYVEINPSFSFYEMEGYRNSFSTMCGGAGKVVLYSISPQFGSKNGTIKITDEGLSFSFERSYDDACFNAVGLNVSIDGIENHFERYHNMCLVVWTKNDIEFTGVHFTTPRNERFYMVPFEDGQETRNMVIKGGCEKRLYFNFDSGINKMESTIKITPQMKNMISGMQVTFRNYSESNEVILKELVFYYGETNEVKEKEVMDKIYKYE